MSLVLAMVAVTALPLFGSTPSFSVPDDVALRIRLDDTLTTTDSQVGDPFRATVVDTGDYQNARVYGHIAQIDMSGRIKGHISMMLRFDRLVMTDGRRAPIHAEIVELYHPPSGEKVDVEGAIESGGRGRKTIEHTVIGAGDGALLGGIFGGGKGAGIGSVIGGAGGPGTTAFHGHQKITLNSGQEMLIRITGRWVQSELNTRSMHMASQNNVLSREHGYAGVTFTDDKGPRLVRDEKFVLSCHHFKEESFVSDHEFDGIIGSSAPLMEVLDLVRVVAPTDSTVLIEGETGTGKELIARAIHKRSNRSHRAFVSVNCAALAPTLIASELFGHEKGAFTGAMQQRLGRFELASGGTIFLDEVGELPLDTQVALLRVLQEREFERVGGTRSIQVDVRVIAATNRDLEAAVVNGTFRSDLFYRLNVFPIELPPLRKRKEDIPVLIEHFVNRFAEKVGRQFSTIARRTLELCESYHWPGNIRELQNVVERSVIVSSGDMFRVDEAWLSRNARRVPAPDPGCLSAKPDPSPERQIIEAALAESRGRVSGPCGAAAKLRIPPSTLESRIRALDISKVQFKFS